MGGKEDGGTLIEDLYMAADPAVSKQTVGQLYEPRAGMHVIRVCRDK